MRFRSAFVAISFHVRYDFVPCSFRSRSDFVPMSFRFRSDFVPVSFRVRADFVQIPFCFFPEFVLYDLNRTVNEEIGREIFDYNRFPENQDNFIVISYKRRCCGIAFLPVILLE